MSLLTEGTCNCWTDLLGGVETFIHVLDFLTPLFACSGGQLDIDCQKANGLTPAGVAAKKGDISGLMKLSDLGANTTGIELSSAALKQNLWTAVRNGDVAVIRGAKRLRLLTTANCRNHQVKEHEPLRLRLPIPLTILLPLR